MSIQSKEFLRFVKMLNDNGCLSHVVLVGSWAEFLYRECGLIKDYDPNIKTLDIDFLLKNLKKPKEPINLITLAREEGYLIENDYITGSTKIYDKSGLEIEFLLNKTGAGAETVLKTNLGVTAQTVRHMGIILNNTMTVDYFNMKVAVPAPEAYLIHKIVINPERGKKQEKDRVAVIRLWEYIDKKVFDRIYESLTKKEKTIVDSFMKENLMIR